MDISSYPVEITKLTKICNTQHIEEKNIHTHAHTCDLQKSSREIGDMKILYINLKIFHVKINLSFISFFPNFWKLCMYASFNYFPVSLCPSIMILSFLVLSANWAIKVRFMFTFDFASLESDCYHLQQNGCWWV